MLEDVYNEALTKSQGSVQKELDSQLASIESHLNSLKNSWDNLWVNDKNREIINFFLDLAKSILDVANEFGALNTLLVGGGGIFAAFKTFKGDGKWGFKIVLIS